MLLQSSPVPSQFESSNATSTLRCWAEIDLAALERNLGRIRAELPKPVQYVAVVKADAYGHGVQETVTRLMQAGADAFAVANIEEAIRIREIGKGWPILILSPVLPAEAKRLFDYDLIATVSSFEEVEHLDNLARLKGKPLPVHLKIDTGMGRSGIWFEKAAILFRALERAEHLDLQGIYTHFSCADSSPDYTHIQRTRFIEFIKSIPELPSGLMIHADNSAGLNSLEEDSPFNAIRVGLLQFGAPPYANSLFSKIVTEPVLSFHTRVGLVKSLPEGTPISYGRSHILKRPSRLAILTAGYADGLPTAMSNKGNVLINNELCPILGRVTMDQTVVDITDLPDPILPGTRVTLIGSQETKNISIHQFSHWSDQIPWEAYASITKRVPRVYKTPRNL